VSHCSFACDLFSTLSRGLDSLFLTLTRLVVVFIFVNFSFALFTPPLGDYQYDTGGYVGGGVHVGMLGLN
jgi:hypothetical protein